MPELPWEKWFYSDWLSEEGLTLCEPSTRGIWADAINRMMSAHSYFIEGDFRQLAKLCRCSEVQIQAAICEIKTFKIGNITQHGTNTKIVCRRFERAFRIKELRSKAGKISATKRQHHPQHDVSTPSAYAYASDSASKEGGLGETRPSRFVSPDFPTVKLQAAKIGLSETEAEHFFNYYESNGWRVGKNPMRSWTHALTNWKLNQQNYGNGKHQTNRPNPRNIGVIIGPTDYATAKPKYNRDQEARRDQMEGKMAANANHTSPT